jgi:tRNA threonylcarbamoyl adenosine modification protein (Sua5/YciO/YrdC/YwlC family)
MEIVDVKKEADRAVSLAVEVLKRGGILIYPTDTLYGLGANAKDKGAVSRLMKIKGRSTGLVFSVMLSDVGELVKLVRVRGKHRAALERLPGPYTFVFPTKTKLPDGIGGKQIGLGVRIPDHQLALEIVRKFNAPIITTSVNKTGEPPLANPSEIVEMFEDDVDLFLDSGKITGKPSTVISFVSTKPVVIRKGAGDISFLKELF